jgi:hypothetical protein
MLRDYPPSNELQQHCYSSTHGFSLLSSIPTLLSVTTYGLSLLSSIATVIQKLF